MRKIHRPKLTACLLAVCIAPFASSARADMLGQMPSDAAVVIKVNHISDSVKKASAVVEDLGLLDLVPAVKQWIDKVKPEELAKMGVDAKGDLGIIISSDDLESAPQFAEQGRGVCLLSVTDYKAFVAKLNGAHADGMTTIVPATDSAREMYVQQWGDYAAVTSYRDDLNVANHDGIKPISDGAKTFAQADGIIYFNIAALKKPLLPLLDQGDKSAADMIQQLQAEPAKKKMYAAVTRQVIQMAREFLNDAQGVTIGVNIADKGIKCSLSADFLPNSYLGKLASTMKLTDASLVAGLPLEPYIACGGAAYDPAWTTKVFDDLLKPVISELATGGDDGKKMSDGIAAFRDAMSGMKGGAFEAIAPNNPAGQPGGMMQEIWLCNGDAAKLKSANGQMMEMISPLLNGMMGLILQAAPNGAAMGNGDIFKSTTTPEFKTIAGVSLDKWQVEVDPNNPGAFAMQMSQSWNMMYGPDGMVCVGGVVNDHTYLGGLSLPDAMVEEAITTAKSGTDAFGDDLKDINANLPKQRMVVEYFSISQYLNTVINMVKAQGAPIPLTVPANLPPLGVTIGAADSSLRGDIYIPTTLIQGMMQFGIQAQRMAQPNNGNHGGGL
jgi:hypothetical protein